MNRCLRHMLCTVAVGLAVAPAAGHAAPALFETFAYAGRTEERVPLGPDQYRNPVLSGYYPDPSLTRVGDTYYSVNSSFAHWPGLPVFRSRDLVRWEQIGNAIDRPTQVDFSGREVSEGLFAPDISYHAGQFFIVNTCVGCRGNFVITASDPAGPWSDPVWLPFEGIDPSIYWEGDRAFIVNNRAPDEAPRYEGHRAIWVQEFDWRARRMVGPSTQIVNGGVDITKKPVWIEGPHLLRRDGYYYLSAAEGGTADAHSQVVFRSRRLKGPYQPFDGNPILTQRDLPPGRLHPITSAGHAKFVQTQKGDWWATFLATRPYAAGRYAIGRETFLLPVTWRAGWPRILDPREAIPFVATRPDLPAGKGPALPTSGDFGYIEAFDGNRLGPAWIGIRNPARPFHTVSGGVLRLEGAAALGDRSGVPAFIGRRLQHHVATISTTLRFAPERDGARAGLAAVQNDRSWLFFGIARINGEARIALFSRDRTDSDALVASAPIDAKGPVTLTIRMTGGRIAFDYQGVGQRGTLKDGVDASVLTTDRAGGFVGTVIGPYAFAG